MHVTPDELWEFRNSLLHMTNAASRRVEAGRVKGLIFHVGTLPANVPADFGSFKSFDLLGLIQAIANAGDRLVADLNRDRPRLVAFLERYDRILSDVRYDEWRFGTP